MKATQRNLLLMMVIALPFIYLASIWNILPEKVPLHFDIDGNVDRYGSKMELLMIPILLPLLTFVILSLAPRIDPKKQMLYMGQKYQSIKVILTVLMSLLAIYILHTALQPEAMSVHLLLGGLGGLFIILGNYFQTIRPNYFFGIRTPWTLSDPDIWKSTHRRAGRLWIIGGLLILVLSFFLSKSMLPYAFLGITAVLALAPVVDSYWQYRTGRGSSV